MHSYSLFCIVTPNLYVALVLVGSIILTLMIGLIIAKCFKERMTLPIPTIRSTLSAFGDSIYLVVRQIAWTPLASCDREPLFHCNIHRNNRIISKHHFILLFTNIATIIQLFANPNVNTGYQKLLFYILLCITLTLLCIVPLYIRIFISGNIGTPHKAIQNKRKFFAAHAGSLNMYSATRRQDITFLVFADYFGVSFVREISQIHGGNFLHCVCKYQFYDIFDFYCLRLSKNELKKLANKPQFNDKDVLAYPHDYIAATNKNTKIIDYLHEIGVDLTVCMCRVCLFFIFNISHICLIKP